MATSARSPNNHPDYGVISERYDNSKVGSRLPSPQGDQSGSTKKRKLSSNQERAEQAGSLETSPLRIPAELDPNAQSISEKDEDAPEVAWADYFGIWPLAHPKTNPMIDNHRKKRPRNQSQNSYDKSVSLAESPRPWTLEDAESMEDAGLIISERQTQAEISEECQQLCHQLLDARHPLPDKRVFQAKITAKIFALARLWDKAHIVRDVTPLIVPSAVLLHIVDEFEFAAGISESLVADWDHCNTIHGPRPKPDFVAGVARSALNPEEREKLGLFNTSATPKLFPEGIYFPFLICEVRDSDAPIDEAEWQLMHSASIAVRAVIQLFQLATAASEVECKLLVFSVAHNHSNVRMYGHYAKIDGEKWKFYRKRLYCSEFAPPAASEEWQNSWQITVAIYQHFYPLHLARIRGVLARVNSPDLVSFTSPPDSETDL